MSGSGGTAGTGGAPNPPFSPSTLSGLVLWLDASLGVTADGANKVSAWTDRSTHQNDAAQVDASHRPSLVKETINGHSSIHFDGDVSQAYLAAPDSGSLRWGTGDFTVHVIAGYSNAAIQPTFGMLYGKFLTTAPFPGVVLWGNYQLLSNAPVVGLAGQLNSDDGTIVYAVAGLNDGHFRDYSVRRVSGQVRLAVNNGTPSTFAQTTASDVSAAGSPVYFGSNPTTPKQCLIGDIAEVIAVSGVLSDLDDAQLHSYFVQKYAL